MNIFSWLLIGHLVGDWLLQNDWMAANKQRHLFTLAGMTHFAIYTSCMALVLFIAKADSARIFSIQQLLLFVIVIFVSHWLIDATAFARKWARFTNQSDLPIVNIMVDQTFHLLVIVALIKWTL